MLEELWEQAQGSDGFNDETVKKIAEADPNELAQAYLDYRSQNESAPSAVQMTEEQANNLKNAVGGEEQYNRMIGWASDNMTEQEIELYDGIMEKGDPAAAYFAVQALAYRYQDANVSEGNLCLLYTSPSPRDQRGSRMPSSA